VNGPDPRSTLARPDLASARLEGLVRAARYASETAMLCAVPTAPVRRAPSPVAEQVDQLLFGEAFDVAEVAGDWAWGEARRDGYVGFVRQADLERLAAAPTHRLAALRAYALSGPDIKAPAVGLLSINALLRIEAVEGAFVLATGLGWVARRALEPIGAFETDFVAVAERFVGAAYLWGGREAGGVDCSGLVQQALLACGRACPRDSDQQRLLGKPAPVDDLRRGDLVFWERHVAIMTDGSTVLHANGIRGCAMVEPLADAVREREQAGAGRPIAHRRL
jgi:hypothetical protein